MLVRILSLSWNIKIMEWTCPELSVVCYPLMCFTGMAGSSAHWLLLWWPLQGLIAFYFSLANFRSNRFCLIVFRACVCIFSTGIGWLTSISDFIIPGCLFSYKWWKNWLGLEAFYTLCNSDGITSPMLSLCISCLETKLHIRCATQKREQLQERIFYVRFATDGSNPKGIQYSFFLLKLIRTPLKGCML